MGLISRVSSRTYRQMSEPIPDDKNSTAVVSSTDSPKPKIPKPNFYDDFFAKRKAEDRDPDELPKKKNYRQRAHSNPLSDLNFEYPVKPSLMDWTKLYPVESIKFPEEKVRFVDVGCGYGGLLLKLAEGYPNKLALGMEIRVKVLNYVNDRIKALQLQNVEAGTYDRVGCIRTNAM